MRKIKFRAWDKEEKKITTWETILQYFSISHFEDEEFEFMQYTGLKDKSGVEIYEGDIITADHYKLNLEKISINVAVEWGGWCYVLKFKDDSFYGTLDRVKLNSINAEVIGNIYENPELLKGDTK